LVRKEYDGLLGPRAQFRVVWVPGANFTSQDILAQLDECAGKFGFPMLDNGHVYLVDVRLSAYRDDARWALVIEVLGFDAHVGGHDGTANCLYCFGNCLKRAPGMADDGFLCVTGDGPEGPAFDEELDEDVRTGIRSIRIRGSVVPVDLRTEVLAEKGIELAHAPNVTDAELLRSLTLEYRDLLLAAEEELRERVPADLPLILRLEEWHHPDLAEGELPGESTTFRMIADVLASGDASRYRPALEPNTHWKNWPAGGSLAASTANEALIEQLESCGWWAEMPEAEREATKERLREDPYERGYLNLAAVAFDSEALDFSGPGSGYDSYHDLINRYAEGSWELFRPTNIKDEHDEAKKLAHVAFDFSGERYETTVPLDDGWFDARVQDLINDSLERAGIPQRFIAMPVVDQTIEAAFISPATYERAVAAGAIPTMRQLLEDEGFL
jgi:hypothetical protein